jgi:hypothetical protein
MNTLRFAGKDSRVSGCEKGFSHQRESRLLGAIEAASSIISIASSISRWEESSGRRMVGFVAGDLFLELVDKALQRPHG